MAAISSPSVEVKQFCKALGLDSSKVKNLTLKINLNEVVTVDVEMMPSDKNLEFLGKELQRFHLFKPDEKENV